MFFFRAVIYLLMQHRIYPYIAYRGIAGSQLKKSLPMQRYFLPCNQKYNLHLTEYVSPITVEVTEPLRFFFCRFLSECAAGLFLLLAAVRLLSNLVFSIFKNFRLEEKRMAYNNGRENRKWLIWKEAEEKILREHGVDENTIEQIRTDDRADFNSNRRFYHWTSDFGEYLEGMADREQDTELKTVADLLDEIEDETLYRALLTVDRRTLQIILLKMQGYSTKEIAPLVGLTTGAIYARLDHLRKKLRKIL